MLPDTLSAELQARLGEAAMDLHLWAQLLRALADACALDELKKDGLPPADCRRPVESAALDDLADQLDIIYNATESLLEPSSWYELERVVIHLQTLHRIFRDRPDGRWQDCATAIETLSARLEAHTRLLKSIDEGQPVPTA